MTATSDAERQHGAGRAGRLIGRRIELAALEDAIATALEGRFALVVVEGQPGIGKSRVLGDALTRVPAGVRVGRARCCELERSVPYTALATALREALGGLEFDARCEQALAGILPELALSSAPAADDPRALEALVDVVRRVGPLVLVLDDLHHADPATVMAIGYLARRCADAPVAIVAAVRPAELRANVPAYALEPTLVVRLGPLSRRELAAAGVAGFYDRTGGHPLLVNALAAGDGELPRPMVEHVLDRCRAEGLFAFRTIATAAVLEQPFAPELLTLVLDAPAHRVADALERLCEQGLLRATETRFAFRFPLIAEVLEENLTPFGRSALLARARGAQARVATAFSG